MIQVNYFLMKYNVIWKFALFCSIGKSHDSASVYESLPCLSDSHAQSSSDKHISKSLDISPTSKSFSDKDTGDSLGKDMNVQHQNQIHGLVSKSLMSQSVAASSEDSCMLDKIRQITNKSVHH